MLVACFTRDDSRLVPNQWETSLQSNAVSHWLGANLESALFTVLTAPFHSVGRDGAGRVHLLHDVLHQWYPGYRIRWWHFLSDQRPFPSLLPLGLSLQRCPQCTSHIWSFPRRVSTCSNHSDVRYTIIMVSQFTSNLTICVLNDSIL